MTHLTNGTPKETLLEIPENHYIFYTKTDGIIVIPISEVKEVFFYNKEYPSTFGAKGYVVVESTENENSFDFEDCLFVDVENLLVKQDEVSRMDKPMKWFLLIGYSDGFGPESFDMPKYTTNVGLPVPDWNDIEKALINHLMDFDEEYAWYYVEFETADKVVEVKDALIELRQNHRGEIQDEIFKRMAQSLNKAKRVIP